jgi:hypothetical protein
VAYATLIDVQHRAPARTFTASSKPNASAVFGFLEESQLILDGVLRAAGYELPIATTATSALRILRTVNAIGAWSMVEKHAPGPKPAGQQGEAAERDFISWLNKLDPRSKGPTIELDAAKSSTAGGAYARAKTLEEAGIASRSNFFSVDQEF